MDTYMNREELSAIISVVDALAALSLASSQIGLDVVVTDTNGETLGYIGGQADGEYTFRTKKNLDD